MGRSNGKKPSPAIVISIVALVFAVAGTAVAGVATISVLSKKEKKQTRKIARNEINKAAPGLSVAHAANAESAANATTAASASNADNATQADSAASVNGVDVEGIVYRQSGTADDPQMILDLGGLILTANCSAGLLTVNARTSVNNATLSSAVIDTANKQISASTVHVDDFDTLLTQGLIGFPPNDLVLNVQYTRPPTTLLTSPSATSVLLMVDNDGAPTCLVTGHAFQTRGALTS